MILRVLNRKYFLIGHFRYLDWVNTNTDLNTVDLKSLIVVGIGDRYVENTLFL